MADTKLTGLTATTTPVLTDEMYIVTTPGGTPASHYATLDILQQILSVKNVADGRLTLESGVPVSTSDQTAKTTLYYTFYKGNKIGLYDGTSWHVRTFAELSITLASLTATRPYDVFCYDNSGTPALELLAWTSTTARATALAYQDGVLVKSGAATRRYLGTICITGTTGQCEDSLVKRLVWNYYNRVMRYCSKTEATSHAYNGGVRAWNNDTTQKMEFVIGVAEDAIIGNGIIQHYTSAAYSECGLSLNAFDAVTLLLSAQMGSNTSVSTHYNVVGSVIPAIGYQYYGVYEVNNGNTQYVTFRLKINIQG